MKKDIEWAKKEVKEWSVSSEYATENFYKDTMVMSSEDFLQILKELEKSEVNT